MKLLTVKEVSEILSIAPQTLYQWAELGKIPSYKLNGCLRFDEADIMAWLETCKKGVSSVNFPYAETVACKPGKGDRKHGRL